MEFKTPLGVLVPQLGASLAKPKHVDFHNFLAKRL